MTPSDDQFIAEYAPLVRRIAARLRQQMDITLEREELEAWGNVGLLEARRRFDPDRGVRFSTFAYYRIRGEMIDGIRRGGYVSRRAHARLRAAEAIDDVAEPLATGHPQSAGARARLIDDTLGKLTAAYTIAAVGQDAQDRDTPDAEAHAESRQLTARMRDLLEALPERERLLIRGVYFEGRTLEGVARELGLSKSWGSRLHAKVLAKLRDEMAG